MQEEHDRRWKKVAEDVDDLLECFRGFDRGEGEDPQKARRYINALPGRRRLAVGVLSDAPGARAGGAGAEIAEAEAEGREPPPEKVPTMPDLAKAEQAFKDLQEQGVFTQKQVDEELELSEKGVVGLCESRPDAGRSSQSGRKKWGLHGRKITQKSTS